MRNTIIVLTGIAAFFCIAAVAIVWVATLSPFGQLPSEPGTVSLDYADTTIPDSLVKTPPKAITLKGKVLKPDGTPAVGVRVRFQAITLKDPQEFEFVSNNYGFRDTDREGQFELSRDIPADTTLVFYTDPSSLASLSLETLVSEPFVFLADKDRDDIVIQLQEGIRVDGIAIFDDGESATGRLVAAYYQITPLFDAEKLNGQKSIPIGISASIYAVVHIDGKYELYLPPGEFQLKYFGNDEDSQPVPLSIKDRQKEHFAVLIWPDPPRGKFVKEDGSAPGILRSFHISDDGRSCRAPIQVQSDGRYTLLEKEKGSILFAITVDGSLGIIHSIPDEELDEFQTVVLKPTATATLQLHDSTGQPLSGQMIQVLATVKGGEDGAAYGGLSVSATDVDGVATFRLPPGTADYRLTWDGGEKEFNRTLQSGEVVDLGVVAAQQ